jgi:adenylate cyclase
MLERMFLTKSDQWRGFVQPGEKTRLGFLSTDNTRIVSVKLVEVESQKVKAELRVFQSQNTPDPKNFNFLISIEEAEELLEMCHTPILNYTKHYFGIKTNFYSKEDPQVWYVKEYKDPHKGFVITGVVLKDDTEILSPPEWVGAEITNDQKYQNYNIATCALTPIEKTLGISVL